MKDDDLNVATGGDPSQNWQDAMTSVQTMYRKSVRNLTGLGISRFHGGSSWVILGLVLLVFVTGCATRKPHLDVNAPLRSPYLETKVWAVAPLVNETGVSILESLHITDIVVKEVAQIDGVEVVPLQRVLDALRAMNIGEIQTPAEARSIARLVGADGLIIGSITAYDPYDPPILGLALELYTREVGDADNGMQRLSVAASDGRMSDYMTGDHPASRAAAIIDSSDNGVRIDLQYFAKGRTDPNTALGWRRYMKDMDLYTEYVSHRMVRLILYEESVRIRRTARKRSAPPSS